MQYNIVSAGGPPGTSPAASRTRSGRGRSGPATGSRRCGAWPPTSGSARRRWPTPTANCSVVACWSGRDAGGPMSAGSRRSPPDCPWPSHPASGTCAPVGRIPTSSLRCPVRGAARRPTRGYGSPAVSPRLAEVAGTRAGRRRDRRRRAGGGGRGPRRGRTGARGLAAPGRPGDRRGSGVHRVARPAGGAGHGGGPGRDGRAGDPSRPAGRRARAGCRRRAAHAPGSESDGHGLGPGPGRPSCGPCCPGIRTLLVIEDDHAGPAAGVPATTVCRGPRALGHDPLGVQVARPRPPAGRPGR